MPGGLTIEEVASGVWRITDPGYAQPSHAYLILGEQRAGLIDSGTGLWSVRGAVGSITDLGVVVLQTHAHPDHAGASHQFDSVWAHPRAVEKLAKGWEHIELQFDIKRYWSARELPEDVELETFAIPGCRAPGELENRGFVDLGGRQLDVFFTPGHSPDSVCFLELDDGLLFTGDSVVKGRIAVEDSRAYRRSINEIAKLSELATAIFPAHGESPIEPDFVANVRRGFSDAISDRAPSGFLAGFATFEFDDFGIMIPPRHRRLRDE